METWPPGSDPPVAPGSPGASSPMTRSGEPATRSPKIPMATRWGSWARSMPSSGTGRPHRPRLGRDGAPVPPGQPDPHEQAEDYERQPQ